MSWGIPVLAVLLTAFAEPEYQSATPPGAQTNAAFITTLQGINKTTISGKVVNGSGDPLNGATIIIRGTDTGTVADEKGNFSLKVPESEDVEIVISYVGFKSIVAKIAPKKDYLWNFTMEKEVIGIDTKSMFLEKEMPAPPPPPLPGKTSPGEPGEEVFFVVEEMPEYPGGHYELGQYVRRRQNELKPEKIFAARYDLTGSF